ncbi:hypothetical protein H2198_006300 [Neophaeococcomyces mojaviensis]|uniref:Uncharacterized protein n=1 Tax=Neophaeococcomyces mojaviensis TaxID=3383035 RepID=A0ACC3A3C8_9EURO|nr:hypothetical protein H2198_006300 [Knufia sp. JES_112]
MASIFPCADIFLSAASARNSTEGCGIDNPLEPASRFLFPFVLDNGYDILARVCDAPSTRLLIRKESGASSRLETCPIQKRGWILQEILLARRVLYFIEGHMIWHCHNLLQAEDGHFTKTDYNGILCSAPLYNWKEQLQTGMEVRVWWDILRNLFRRNFTKLEDTLPSLVGLMYLWQGYTNDEPVLGLWKKDLPFHMCWFFGSSLSVVDRVRGQPSWCWTSVPQEHRGIIEHISLDYVVSEDIVWQAVVEVVNIQWEGRPFVSHFQHADLSLNRVRATKGAFYQAKSYMLDNKEEKEFMRPEALEIVPLIIIKPSCTEQPGEARFRMHSLLVERINLTGKQAKYRRKGHAEFLSLSDCADSEIEERVDEIIGGIETIDVIEVI